MYDFCIAACFTFFKQLVRNLRNSVEILVLGFKVFPLFSSRKVHNARIAKDFVFSLHKGLD